jgi:Tol biopolymer transport system component
MNHTEIFTMDSNGTNARQLTVLNATSLTPKFLPSGNGNDGLIMFSSNYGGEQQTPRPFSLFIANQQQDGKLNGNNVKKVGIF